MRDIRPCLENLSILDLCLVGTHNSATYNIKRKNDFGADAPKTLTSSGADGSIARVFARNPTARWSKCQRMSVLEQLRFGVRYLDYRVVLHADGDAHISHGQISVTLRQALQEIVDFFLLPTSADEFVILDIQHLYGFDSTTLATVFFPILDVVRHLCIANTVPLSTPLSDLRDARGENNGSPCQGRLFLFLGTEFDSLAYPFIYPRRNFIFSDWKNKNRTEELIEALTSDLRQGEGLERKKGCICVTQAVLSPVAANFAKSMVFIGSRSIKQYAEKVNPRVLEWFWHWVTAHEVKGESGLKAVTNIHRNVLLLDFAEVGCFRQSNSTSLNSVQLCVTANIQRFQKALLSQTAES